MRPAKHLQLVPAELLREMASDAGELLARVRQLTAERTQLKKRYRQAAQAQMELDRRRELGERGE